MMTTSGTAQFKDRPGALTMVWLAMSSLRTTAILAIILALLSGVAAFVPQGSDVLLYVRSEGTTTLQTLAAWGLTNIFASEWLRALGVLLGANVLCVFARFQMAKKADGAQLLPAPERTPLEATLKAPVPERAVEIVREILRSAIGSKPAAETVEDSRVSMVFDTSPGGKLAPLLAHIGLIMLVVGAGASVQPTPRSRALAHAVLEVKDSQTGFVGTFDMAEGEPFEFFRWRSRYTVRDFVGDKDGLGPAVQIERSASQGQRGSRFWVYQSAPDGFDERHRRGQVAMRLKRARLMSIPGQGIASSPIAILLMIGLGILAVGATMGARAEGRIWVEIDGEDVRLAGVPQQLGDAAFGARFRAIEALVRGQLEA